MRGSRATIDTDRAAAPEAIADFAADAPRSLPSDVAADERPSLAADVRRSLLARGIVRTLRRAIADPDSLEIVLDDPAPAVAAQHGAAATHHGAAAAQHGAVAAHHGAAATHHGAPPGADPARGADLRPRATVVLRGADAVGRLVLPPTPDALAEGYLRGDLDIEGDVMAAVEAGSTLDLRRLGPSDLRRAVRWGLELRRGTPSAPPLRRAARLAGARHSQARDMAAVRFHYDVGEAFFGLWLDRRLAYSCAYFPDGTTADSAVDRLDQAQESKLDLIARKVRLAPGARFLDIGCGWGSLVVRAAETTGCDAVGITLSQRQADEANARADAAGLGERARVEVRDYRDLASLGRFDAVASVGMFEHVGRTNLPVYFSAAFEALRPGGLFLNHGIAEAGVAGAGRVEAGVAGAGRVEAGVAGAGLAEAGLVGAVDEARVADRRLPIPGLGVSRPATPLTAPRSRISRLTGAGTSRFIDRYVFPDGELVPVDEALAVARAAGFEVIDVQSLRPHYALTLAAWIARLEARWDEAVAAAGEEVARTWRLYMSASRLGFEQGAIDVCQILLARPEGGRPASRPLRPWW